MIHCYMYILTHICLWSIVVYKYLHIIVYDLLLIVHTYTYTYMIDIYCCMYVCMYVLRHINVWSIIVCEYIYDLLLYDVLINIHIRSIVLYMYLHMIYCLFSGECTFSGWKLGSKSFHRLHFSMYLTECYWNIGKKICNFSVSTMLSDGLALLDVRTYAGKMLPNLGPMYMRQALKRTTILYM